MEYLFLSGVHGSEKYTLTQKLEKKINIHCGSFSSLIRRAGNEIEVNNRKITNIKSNQNLWKSELNKMNSQKDYLLLDGAFYFD